MEWPLIAVVVTSLLGFIIVGVSTLVFYGMVRDINTASPEDQRMNFWKLGLKSRRVFSRHRELFPESRKRSRMGWLSTVGLLLSFGAMISGVLATNVGWIKN
jgi:hypothetical protein